MRIEMPVKKKPKIVSGDKILEKVSAVLQPINKKVEKSDDHALLVLAVNIPNLDSPPITTLTITAGLYDIIARGLHAELCDEISNGHSALFTALQLVVHDIEREYGMNLKEKPHLH